MSCWCGPSWSKPAATGQCVVGKEIVDVPNDEVQVEKLGTGNVAVECEFCISIQVWISIFKAPLPYTYTCTYTYTYTAWALAVYLRLGKLHKLLAAFTWQGGLST